MLFDNLFELATIVMDKYYEEFQWNLNHREHGFDGYGFTPLEILEHHLQDGFLDSSNYRIAGQPFWNPTFVQF